MAPLVGTEVPDTALFIRNVGIVAGFVVVGFWVAWTAVASLRRRHRQEDGHIMDERQRFNLIGALGMYSLLFLMGHPWLAVLGGLRPWFSDSPYEAALSLCCVPVILVSAFALAYDGVCWFSSRLTRKSREHNGYRSS